MDILTGNELVSGATVYLSRDGRWLEDIQQARLFGPDETEARDAALAATKATMRINSLEVETASFVDGRVVPDRIREQIRVSGPTAPPAKPQHLREGDHVSI
jgi:hypothetical protein